MGGADIAPDETDCSPGAPPHEAETEAAELTLLLDAIPGAWEQAELGRIQAAAGQTIPLHEL